MLKKFLIGASAALAFSTIHSVSTMASDVCDKVKIDKSGVITLVSDHAANDGINTLQLNLKVETKDDADISFEFDSENNIKVSEYRYNPESNQLNIYMSDSQPLFNGSDLLNIGAVSAKDADGNDVSVTINEVEDALKYVYNNTLINVDVDFNIETATTTTSATTSKPITTTTTSTTTSKSTTATTKTSATTSKSTTATTKTSTTTSKSTTATTTTSATTSKPITTTTTTSATASKPITTTTTTSATTSEPTTTTTTTSATTLSKLTTSITTADPMTTSTTVKHIASNEVLCDWSMNNYNDKEGIMPDSAEITEKADGNYQITLIDNADNVLDIYIINPETGIGTDLAGNEVNLPQTGNNSLKNVLTAAGAFMMIVLGFCAVKLSGITRRKKNEQ